MNWLLSFLSIMFVSISAYATCPKPRMSSCTYVNLVSCKLNFLTSIMSAKLMRHLVIEEVHTKTEWSARLTSCPKTSFPAFVFIKPVCWYDHLPQEADYMAINTEDECKIILERREKKFSEMSSMVKPGIFASELLKLGFKEVYQLSSDTVAVYRMYPNFEISVEISQEKCETGETCIDRMDKKIIRIVEMRDFNTNPNWTDE